MSDKGITRKEIFTTSAMVVLCIFMNVIGEIIAKAAMLPAWLDSFGTVLAAYALGPFCGAIVGCSGNVILSFWNERSLLYALTSVLIGLSIGLAAREKYFETFFHSMSVAGIVTMVSVVISSSLNFLVYGGMTGNVWGNGVCEYLMERHVPMVIASVVGQLYIEFADKLLTVVGLYFMIRLARYVKVNLGLDEFDEDDKGEDIPKPASGSVNTVVACVLVAAAVAGASYIYPFTASADTAESPDTPAAEEQVHDLSYIRTVYNADNGLPCGHANDVVQTHDGILWVGSYSGLYRYNGAAFKFMSEFDTVKNVNCLFVDDEGRLWIGTNDNGVVVAINEKVSGTLDIDGGLPSNSVRCIVQSSDGDYYIGTSENAVVVRLEMGIKITQTLPGMSYMKSVAADNDGSVAGVTAAGTLHIMRKGKVVYDIKEREDTFYTCCTFDDEGNLYAGTTDGRVIIYKVDGLHATKITETRCGDLSGINSVYMQNNSMAWVVSDNGLGILRDMRSFTHIETEGFNYSLEHMTLDYQSNIWVASSRMGLMQLSPSPLADIFGDYGLEASVVNTTAIKDGLLYMGTDNGLLIIDTIKKERVENKLTELLADARVRCIITDSDGDLWVCSYGKGLTEVRDSGEIVEFDGDRYGIGSRVRVCIQLKNGTMAVGGDKGVYFIKNERVVKSMLYGDELGAAKVLTLLEMPDETLLAGTDGNGITIIKDGEVTGEYTRKDGLSSAVILRMVKDLDTDDVFIATGNGLCILSGSKVKEMKSFPYSNNYDIMLDDDGDVFVTGSSGVYVVNRSEFIKDSISRYTLINSRVGLRGSLTSNAWNAIDGKDIYLSTDRGVFTLNMDSYKTGRRFYRLTIADVMLDGVSVTAKRGTGLTIGRNVTSVELVPEVINYTLDNPNISYRLDGLDTSWKTVPQKDLSHIVYTNLPAGEYVFRLAILDPETGKTLEESSLSFQKDKAIYDNTWFRVYMIVIGVIFTGWLTWFLTRRGIERTMEIQQTRLDMALQQVQMGNETILAIAKTVDAKDVRTSRHSQRVSEYSVKIAEKYGFSPKELENLRKSALLHDIGKIGIPDAILNKPARLTDEEYAVMKTHVTRGAEILKDFTLIEHAVDGARYHHERYDGRGYPDGLSGENIPLYGRIIAIADAFDAMTANRVYRKKQDFDYVLGELKKGRGTQFDPELDDIFLKLIDDGEIDIEALYAPSEEIAEDSKDKDSKDTKDNKDKDTKDSKDKDSKDAKDVKDTKDTEGGKNGQGKE